MKVFIEEQRINKPLVIIVLSIVFIGICISIINKWDNSGSDSLIDKIVSFGILVILLLVALLFLNLKLKTRIDEKGIYFQLYPIHFSYKLIPWNEISTCFIRQYKAIYEFGGWGLRISFRKKVGRAYTVQGNIGLQLELMNGKRILIGTQKKEEIQRVLDNYNWKIVK